MVEHRIKIIGARTVYKTYVYFVMGMSTDHAFTIFKGTWKECINYCQFTGLL